MVCQRTPFLLFPMSRNGMPTNTLSPLSHVQKWYAIKHSLLSQTKSSQAPTGGFDDNITSSLQNKSGLV
uniref:Uncharacterized protein n=1 Tax=Solanum tuberosum TaxID=4113 RepID=M1ARV5_SOLTU